jgi:hypothetical protein
MIDLTEAKIGDKFVDCQENVWVYAEYSKDVQYHLLSVVGDSTPYPFNLNGKCILNFGFNLASKLEEPNTMSNLTNPTYYTLIPNTQVIHSKIDVFEIADPNDDNKQLRVELTVDNDGVFITSVHNCAREDVSIGEKDLAVAVARAILAAYGEN